MTRLAGKRAIVTGAAAGIGKAIAERFTGEGARVVVVDIDSEGASRTAGQLDSGELWRQVDVTRAGQVSELIEWTVETLGGLDVMVNNAGVGVAATVPETSEEQWQTVIDVNLKGVFLGMKYAIPAIRASGGGAVINMSSVAALVGVADRAAYCAAKGGIAALTRAAAIDHVAEGVRVNCIAPGTVDTPWVDRITQRYEDPKAAKAAMEARQPHGRLVTAEEIAAMAVYLASEEATSTIGATMVVDGGMTAR